MAETFLRCPDCRSGAQSALSAPIDEGIGSEIESLGYHPFVLIRLREDGKGPRFLVCKDQNELAPFVDTLSCLPGIEQDTLLRGLERALQSEPYEAADALFSWVQRPGSEFTEKLYVGVPENVACPHYFGYPVFERAPGRQAGDAEQRLQVLLEAFEAFDRTEGNNATRFAIVESLAFALSRCLGYRGQFALALAIVERAMAHMPKSIHLNAAKHALDYRIEGRALPPRLQKFVGEDNGYLKQFVCPAPFEHMDICDNGSVLVCCGHWLPTVIGNFIKSPIADVLNSQKARKIRQSVTDGSYKYCSHVNCTLMSQGLLPTRKELTNPRVIRALASEKYDVDGVDVINFGLDLTCNLACPSCRTSRIVEKMSETAEKTRAVEEKLYPLLPQVKLLHINPAGELFASKPSRRLLELIDGERCPDVVLNIISNGTLFTEREWNRYPGIHGRVWRVRISTDAATKETFEKLRRLGNYDVFLENVRFLSSLRRSGKIKLLSFSFAYQLDNYREMADFVEFVRSVNGDFATFDRLHNNYGTFSESEFRQKAVHRPGHPLHPDFLRMINQPIFRHPTLVLHDFEYAGREKVPDEAPARRLHRVKMREAFQAFCKLRDIAAVSGDERSQGDLASLGFET